MVEQNQTSCTQAAAAAAAAVAFVAVEHRKSFGKTADQVDHSTMDYTPSACIAMRSRNFLNDQPTVGLNFNGNNLPDTGITGTII